MKKLRYISALLLSVLLVLGLCGCAAIDIPGMNKSEAELYRGDVTAADGFYSLTKDENGLEEAAGDAENTAADFAARKRIFYVSINGETEEFDKCVALIKQNLAACGGYIQKASVFGGGGYGSTRTAEFVLRVPADRLDEFRQTVGSTVTVRNESEHVDDVTADYTDTESRLATLRTEQETLLGLLEKANTMDEILMIRSRLTEVTSDIEAFEARLRTYDALIDYSTVTLTVSEVERITVKEEKSTFGRIGENLTETLHDIGTFFTELFVWFVSALPVLLLIALFVGAILWIIFGSIHHAKKKKARRKAADAEKESKES